MSNKKGYSISVLKAAEKDIDLAFDYYSTINPKLGKRFINLLNAAFKDLEKNPFYQIRYDNYSEVSVCDSLYYRRQQGSCFGLWCEMYLSKP